MSGENKLGTGWRQLDCHSKGSEKVAEANQISAYVGLIAKVTRFANARNGH